MKQNPDADPRDGVFHSMFVGKPTFKQICQAIPKLFSGKINEVDVIHSFTAKDIVVDTKKHLVIEADGILMDFMGPCEIHCLHKALCMTVPNYC